MTPELSRRIAKVATTLRQLLGVEEYDKFVQAAEQARTFVKLDNWYKFLIERAEKNTT